MEDVLRDLKYTLRLCLREPSFSLVVIFVLAVGIGANTAIFTVVNAVLLRSLPFERPERIVWIWGTWPGGSQASVSPPDLADYRQRNRSFQYLGAFANNLLAFNLMVGGEPERVNGSYVTSNFFDVLGVRPELGRTFLPEEEQQGHDRVAILSHALWRQSFGGNKGILGQMLQINGEQYLVAGVMPAGVDLPRKAEIWVPLPSYMAEMKLRRAHSVRPIGRLNPGFTRQQAQDEVDLIAAQLQKEYPDSNTGWGLKLVPLLDQMVGEVRPALWLLMGVTLLVLLIACANVSHLMLVRTYSRNTEMALRAAFGASRISLARQLITEGLLLSLVGSALGVAIAYAGTRVLVAMVPGDIPRIHEVGLDGAVLGFAIVMSLLSGLICGLAPALQGSRANVNEVLKQQSRSGTASRVGNRARNMLVVAEVAIALMLLIGSGLMIQSFLRVQSVDPGFNRNTLTMQIALPVQRYADPARRVAFFRAAAEKIGALPGVQAVGMVSDLPLSGEINETYFNVKGRPPANPNDKPVAIYHIIARNYFQAMGMPLLKGRYFDENEELGGPVVIINRVMAERYFPSEDPIGKHLVIDLGEPMDAQVVGVVANVLDYSLDAEFLDAMYLPIIVMPSTNIVVRTSTNSMSLANPIRREIRTIDNQQPVAEVRTMEQVVIGSMVGLQFRTALVTIFAVIALVLAVAGVYGMMSYSVSRQTGAIGVRLALGAQAGDVVRLVFGQGMKLTLMGLGLGTAGAFILHRFISSLLFGVSTTDWRTYALTAAILTLTSGLACYLPARRAAKMDPVTSLRQQ
jgi:putative ABC transport system permease protein